ncbi:MAG: hypothetical protein N3D85_02045 [Candidatus Bathyarchaeota archaeon]|nr:hypothetical protein [Candidatus Bathyarchaeota archaeon]
MRKQNTYGRGYPVAVLVGLNTNQAVVWSVFSRVVKAEKTLHLTADETNSKSVYTFYEAVVNALRPILQAGVRSIILASPPRTNFSEQFLRHVKNHHTWLIQDSNKAIFAKMTGAATTVAEVTQLTRNPEFKQIITQTTEKETETLLELIEKRLSFSDETPLILYSFEEIETHILTPHKKGEAQPEYLLLTDVFLSSSDQKNRLQRLMQIASNKHVKTRVVKADSPAGQRLKQLGGIVCLVKYPVA